MTTLAPSATSILCGTHTLCATAGSVRPCRPRVPVTLPHPESRKGTCSNFWTEHAYRSGMAIRVALFGTGNCGQIALLQLIEGPRFEPVAVGVSNDEKVGATPVSWPGWTSSHRVRATRASTS